MLRCEDIQRELQAFLDNELDESQAGKVSDHLRDCRDCSKIFRQLTKLPEVLQSWQAPEPSPLLYEKLKARMKAQCSNRGGISARTWVRKVAFHLTEVAAVVALTLSLSHSLRKPPPPLPDDSATLNFYLREHRDVAAQVASFEPSPPPEAHIEVPRHDILYYEFLGEPYEFGRPGIIIRGPSTPCGLARPDASAIANGHALTLAEARKAANFSLVSPPRLHPGYMLDQIRRIDGRDALHLLYTDGIDTISLFEQPLDGQRGLVPDDFREYAVYCNKGLAGGTILAWRDDAVSYVLVGNAEMSELMDMAQSISAAK
ncbi:MAG TPA: zf-HC2 domain-containing protein [Sedimentisphaerales bacterium]|nr:zf-HC2 domain-containing protein [Sedimentisphaerales bacterium]